MNEKKFNYPPLNVRTLTWKDWHLGREGNAVRPDRSPQAIKAHLGDVRRHLVEEADFLLNDSICLRK
jgi:hypothetical protein